MLGLPVDSWMRFFACGFVAGASLCVVPFPPFAALGAFEMLVALAGMIFVATYARCYRQWAWRRMLARIRRLRRAVLARARRIRVSVPGLPNPSRDADHSDPHLHVP